MKYLNGLVFTFTTCLLVVIFGCVEIYLPVENCESLPEPNLTPIAQTPKAVLSSEAGLDDISWLQFQLRDTTETLGGYITSKDEHGGGLVILLTGASTFHRGGRREAALSLYRDYGHKFSEAGFLVWAVALSEDTPYGMAEVDELLETIDWLDEEGRDFLGIERIYVVGYSTGATTANLANLRCDVTAMVSIGGLTQPNQLEQFSALYRQVTDFFPCNTGMLQIRHTLDKYKDIGWDALDVVARVTEIRNPTLFVHIEDDIMYTAANAHALEQAYLDQIAAGNTDMPELTFYYKQRGGHFAYVLDPLFFPPVLAYLNSFERN